MLHVLRIRDFRLLWTAGLISSLGSWLLVLAVPAHVYAVTKSITATGFTLAAEYLPMLALGPVAGALTDRWDRRQVLIAADLFRVIVVLAMLAALSPGRYWIFYVALAAESSGTILFLPASSALTPVIVGTGSELNGASALNALTSGVTRLAGGPLGGILLAFCGIRVLIWADAGSYLVSGLLILAISPGRAARAGQLGVRAVLTDLRDGLRYLRDQPSIRALLPVTIIFLAANASLSAVLIPFGVQHLGGSKQTGFLIAALGAGFLIGAPVLKLLLGRVAGRYLLGGALTGTAGGFLALFWSSSLRTAMPAAVCIGLFGSIALMVPQTLTQRLVANEVLGRVSAVFLTAGAAATLAGAVAGPALVRVVQVTGLAVIAGLLTLVAALLAVVLVPDLRRSLSTPSCASAYWETDQVTDLDQGKLRPVDAEGFRAAWEIVEREWEQTVARAQTLAPEALHERVDGEWSFIETLRHLVFITDAWVLRAILLDPSPWDPLDLPHDERPDEEGVPRDLDARPALEEMLDLRADRMATVRQVIAGLDDESLDDLTEGGRPYAVRTCLQIVLNEERAHRRYAERDLNALESR